MGEGREADIGCLKNKKTTVIVVRIRSIETRPESTYLIIFKSPIWQRIHCLAHTKFLKPTNFT